MPSIEQLVDHVDELSQHLKEARKELADAIEKTDMYNKILTATMKQTSTGCTMPEKVAKKHALNVVLANYKKAKKTGGDE
jgi:predicted site-specific integrase-resolvase